MKHQKWKNFPEFKIELLMADIQSIQVKSQTNFQERVREAPKSIVLNILILNFNVKFFKSFLIIA